jgi:hypothetical protein
METVNWLRLAMRLATTSTIVALLAACGGPGSETDPDMALATAELDPPTCSDGVKSGTESDVDC